VLIGIPATLLIPNRLQTEPLIDWEKEKWYEDDERADLVAESLSRVLEESPEEEESKCIEEMPNEHLCP
jgi:hypothetical protein